MVSMASAEDLLTDAWNRLVSGGCVEPNPGPEIPMTQLFEFLQQQQAANKEFAAKQDLVLQKFLQACATAGPSVMPTAPPSIMGPSRQRTTRATTKHLTPLITTSRETYALAPATVNVAHMWRRHKNLADEHVRNARLLGKGHGETTLFPESPIPPKLKAQQEKLGQQPDA